MSDTDLWDAVLAKAEGQRAKGLSKYGHPVTADDTVDWLTHAIEEHLDAAVYLEAAKSVIEKLRQQIVDLEGEKFQLTEKNKALITECVEWEELVGTTEKQLREEVALWKRKEAEAREELKGQGEMTENLLIKLDTAQITGETRQMALDRERGNLKEALASKERAEKDAAALLKRLRSYYQSEGALAFVGTAAGIAVGLLCGYLLF